MHPPRKENLRIAENLKAMDKKLFFSRCRASKLQAWKNNGKSLNYRAQLNNSKNSCIYVLIPKMKSFIFYFHEFLVHRPYFLRRI
jgi:hypothetical protein